MRRTRAAMLAAVLAVAVSVTAAPTASASPTPGPTSTPTTSVQASTAAAALDRQAQRLQADLDAAQSRLSFHLKVLKEAGLVTDRREGRWSYYALVEEGFGEAHDMVRALATEQPAGRKLKVFGRCCG